MCVGGMYARAPKVLKSPKEQFKDLVDSSENFITFAVLGTLFDVYDKNGELDDLTKKDLLEIDIPYEEVRFHLDGVFPNVKYNNPSYAKQYGELRNFMYNSIKIIFMR